MLTFLVVLLALPPLQEEPIEKTISRREKDAYVTAVKDLEKAAAQIDSEPGEVINKVSGILGNSKIKYFEVRLRIEMRPQEYDKETFYPYQVRGRAHLALARKTADPKEAKSSWDAAVADLQRSADAKVPKSADYLKDAKDGLAVCLKAIKDAERPDDPAVEFRRKHFDPATSDGKYKKAYAMVDGDEGKDLPEEEKVKFRTEADSLCAGFVERQIGRIRNSLLDASAKALRDTSSSTFKRQYEDLVPAESELTANSAKDATLGWVRKHVRTLKTVQANQAKPEELFAAAAEALALDAPDADGDNFWFRTMAVLGSQMIEEVISDRALKSSTARRDVRTRLKEESDKAHAAWKDFLATTDKKVLDRHPDLAERTDKLAGAESGFPVEIPELASFDILTAFTKEDLGRALIDLERGLLDLESKLPARVAVESRQELYTKIVKAGALRRIFERKSEADVIREVRILVGKKLSEAGGPINPGEYGPKVKKVFEGL